MAFQPAVIEVEGDLSLDSEPPVVTEPTEDRVELIYRDSWHYAAPTFDATDGWSHPLQEKSRPDGITGRSVWGRYRIVMGGHERTFFRNRQAIVVRWSHATPFGPRDATLLFPQITPFEEPGDGDLDWLRDGARVKLQRVKEDGTVAGDWNWNGLVDTINPAWTEDGWAVEVEAKGYLYQGASTNNRPTQPGGGQFSRDIGYRIPHRINQIIGRRFKRIPRVVTGIEQWKKGALTDSVLSFVLELLAIGWTTDAVCWSLMDRASQPWQARMVLPDPDTVDYTLALGTEGVSFDLREEHDESGGNVVYGEWVTPEGYRTQNLKYPKLLADPPPVFPLGLGASFSPGGADTGFRPFARWLDRNGYKIYSDDTYDTRDEAEVIDAQDRMGVTNDGLVNATTWGTAFTQADASFDESIYLPIAWDKAVEPYLYTPDGVKLGKNPDYDPTVERREVFINFGENVHRADVHEAAKQIVARSKKLSLVGTVTTKADPEECSLREIRAGKTLAVPYLYGRGGGGVKFHVTEVEVDEESEEAQLLVDTLWRDAFTVRQIHERNKEARHNPGRLRQQNASGLTQDTKPVFDLDNGAGNLYPFQLDAATWRVVPFAAGAWGTFIRVKATTDPATEFALMLFAHRVSSQFCERNVGDPLAVAHPYKENAATLKDAGLIQAWGSKDQPCGYSKANAADGYKSDSDDLTGLFEYDSPVEWWSERVPRLYVAVRAADDTVMDLRFWNQQVDF